MICYIVSTDLLFGSQVTAAARQAGLEIQTVPNNRRLIDNLLGSNQSSVVVLDLTLAGLELESLVATLKENESTTSSIVIAIAPHVHADRLEAARAAGCTYVLSRGSAARDLAEILKSSVTSSLPKGTES